jgi:hypothetical protein
MEIETSQYVDVKLKAESLGCNFPTGIAILPQNFVTARVKSELCYEPTAYVVRELFQTSGILETPLEQEGDRFLIHLQESQFAELILPVIFVSSAFISQNPHLVSVALNVISNYISDWFKNVDSDVYGTPESVKFDLIVQTKKGDYTTVKYRGPVGGLDKIRKIIDGVHSDS